MKILLVRPPITLKVAKRLKPFLHLEPLELEIVAGGVPPNHETRILDLSSAAKPTQVFRRTITEYNPQIIGFTAYSNQAGAVKDLAATAKELLDNPLVMVGGVHATIAPHDLGLPKTIDVVIRGEGATAIKKLLSTWNGKEKLPSTETIIPTTSQRFQELADLPPPALPDYDQVPSPRRDLVDRTAYYSIWHGEPAEKMAELFPRTASVRTSVGCPNRCNFCVVHHLAQGKYYARNPHEVVEEINALEEKHIYFVDDEMFVNPRRAEEIARLLLQQEVRKKYISWARADTICQYPQVFAAWKQAGLSLLYVGLESMEPETLQNYNKGISADTNYQAVEILRQLGIGLHAALMINPEFTMTDFMKVRQTIDRIAPAEVSLTVFSPAPGTELWDKHQAKFICSDPYAFYDCMHTLMPTALPLKKFYAQFSLLYLLGARRNPWRYNKVKVRWRDLARFFIRGGIYGWTLHHIHKDYENNNLKITKETQ